MTGLARGAATELVYEGALDLEGHYPEPGDTRRTQVRLQFTTAGGDVRLESTSWEEGKPERSTETTLVAGVKGTYDQMLDVLRRNGVVPIAPEPGTPFDPTHMEALMQEPADYPVPTVPRLLERGDEFEGRVLRPAKVAVCNSA